MLSKIKLLLNVSILLSVLFISSCDNDSSEKKVRVLSPDSAASYEKSRFIEFAKHKLGDLKFYDFGNFHADSSHGLAAGTEVVNDTVFGIKFYLIKRENREFRVVYETPLLDGSFKEAMTRKIKIGNIEYDLIYYNSQDYFMGSGGGEIFSYIIDMNSRQVYYAHFFTVPDKPTSLYLSQNNNSEAIKEFFIRSFQKDYPELRVVNRDYKLEDIF